AVDGNGTDSADDLGTGQRHDHAERDRQRDQRQRHLDDIAPCPRHECFDQDAHDRGAEDDQDRQQVHIVDGRGVHGVVPSDISTSGSRSAVSRSLIVTWTPSSMTSVIGPGTNPTTSSSASSGPAMAISRRPRSGVSAVAGCTGPVIVRWYSQRMYRDDNTMPDVAKTAAHW